MQGDNGRVPVASNAASSPSAPVVNDVAQQKIDLARQFTGATNNADGGLIAQLTGNPFFTAV